MTSAELGNQRGAVPDSRGRYRLVLPAGWIRIPRGERASEELLDEAINFTPNGDIGGVSALARTGLIKSIRRAIKVVNAQASSADLYAPLVAAAGVPLTCAFAVANLDLASGEIPGDEMLLAMAMADSTARVMDVADTVALRMETARDLDSDSSQVLGEYIGAPVKFLARGVNYILGVPGDDHKWLTISFNVLEPEGASEFAEAQIDLFDSIVATFSWVD